MQRSAALRRCDTGCHRQAGLRFHHHDQLCAGQRRPAYLHWSNVAAEPPGPALAEHCSRLQSAPVFARASSKACDMALDHYYLLGRSGLRVSRLALGTMTFGTEGIRGISGSWGATREVSRVLFDRYLAAGGEA